MISPPTEFDRLRADLDALRQMVRDQGENGKKLRDAIESLRRENARLRSRLARVLGAKLLVGRLAVFWGRDRKLGRGVLVKRGNVWSRRVPGGRRTGGESERFLTDVFPCAYCQRRPATHMHERAGTVELPACDDCSPPPTPRDAP